MASNTKLVASILLLTMFGMQARECATRSGKHANILRKREVIDGLQPLPILTIANQGISVDSEYTFPILFFDAGGSQVGFGSVAPAHSQGAIGVPVPVGAVSFELQPLVNGVQVTSPRITIGDNSCFQFITNVSTNPATITITPCVCAKPTTCHSKSKLNPLNPDLDFVNGVGVELHWYPDNVPPQFPPFPPDPLSGFGLQPCGALNEFNKSGVRWTRIPGAFWLLVEQVEGEYDFSVLDTLVNDVLGEHGIQFIWTFGRTNPLYNDANAPTTPEALAAYLSFIKALVTRYAGLGIMWELYNEPNLLPGFGVFWPPLADPVTFADVSLAVAQMIRSTPEIKNEILIFPGIAETVDAPWFSLLFERQPTLLSYMDAFSVHPYRQGIPETVIPSLTALRSWIRHYNNGNDLPIVVSEWGYTTDQSSGDNVSNNEVKADYLARMWLTCLSQEIIRTSWFWFNDNFLGTGFQFGITNDPYFPGRENVYDKNEAFFAVQNLTDVLGGYRFNKRLAIGSRDEDFILVFDNGCDVQLAVWTTNLFGHDIAIPGSKGTYKVISIKDKKCAHKVEATSCCKFTIKATKTPVIIKGPALNDVWKIIAHWQRLPVDLPVENQGLFAEDDILLYPLSFTNPLNKELIISYPATDVNSTDKATEVIVAAHDSVSLTTGLAVGIDNTVAPRDIAWQVRFNDKKHVCNFQMGQYTNLVMGDGGVCFVNPSDSSATNLDRP